MTRSRLLALALLSTGCATKWNQYDASLYRVTMEPGVDSYQAHVDLLKKWSESSEEMPPGLAAELGFYLASLGRFEEAASWYDQEVAAHPEATEFVAALRAISIEAEPSTASEVER